MPSAHGGVRKGAGRKPGVPNRDKRDVIAKAEALGLMPIDVMLENMKYYHEGVKGLQAKLEEVAKELTPEDFIDGSDAVKELFKLMGQVNLFRDRAEACAVDAAPYIHPKLAAIALSTNPEDEAFKAITDKISPKDAASAYALTLASGR